MSDEIGKGTTTLDYLKVRYGWLGELIDEADSELKRLRAENAELTAFKEKWRAGTVDSLCERLAKLEAELDWFRRRELEIDAALNALKRWSNVTTANELVALHKTVAAFKAFERDNPQPGAGT